MRIEQKGPYTVYSRSDLMASDVIMRANECAGAEIIVLTSAFMDYGHFLKTFDINEEQYQELLKLKTWKQLEAFIQKVWPK